MMSTEEGGISSSLLANSRVEHCRTGKLLPKTSGELLGRLILQLTPRSSMTQLFPCLVPTCPDGSDQALPDVQPVSICGVTPITHCVSVEPPRPCCTSSTAARYTSLKVVLLPSTEHLILLWSGCVTAAYAKERSQRYLSLAFLQAVWTPKFKD